MTPKKTSGTSDLFESVRESAEAFQSAIASSGVQKSLASFQSAIASSGIQESLATFQSAIASSGIQESLTAFQTAIASSGIRESMTAFQAAADRMSPRMRESLDAFQQAVSRLSPELLQSSRQTSEALRQWQSMRDIQSLGSPLIADRQARAWRNAIVHSTATQDEGAEESRKAPPTPKSPNEARVRRMAPPRFWPASRAAQRVMKAADGRQGLDVIVLAADIRHSTDLMDDAVDQHEFADALETFVGESRSTVGDHHGWFANFTGDGFLAFWPSMNSERNVNIRRALACISELFAEFEATHIPRFAANARRYREDTGLSIGLDHGTVAVVQVADAATIVGLAVVGATRLVSAGFEWEVLANNHLGVYFTQQIARGALTGVNVKPVVVTTKDVQALRAYSVEYEWSQRPLSPRP